MLLLRMFLRSTNRRKDGKDHRYFSVVENRRLPGGKTAQRTVLYLGEINDQQQAAWRKTLDVFDETEQRFASVADLNEDLRRCLAGMPILAREQTLLYQAGKFVRRHQTGVAVFVLANVLGIAGIGTGQAWWATALLLEGVPAELAVGAGLTLQAIDLAVSLPVAGIASTLLFRRSKAPDPDNPGLDVVGSPSPTTREPIHAG